MAATGSAYAIHRLVSSRLYAKYQCLTLNPQEREAFIAYSKLPTHRRKIEQALATIREASAIAPSSVSVSWGKDSIVMLHLAQTVQPDIPSFCIGDELEDLQNNYGEVAQAYCDRQPTHHQRILYDETTEGGFFEVVKRLAEQHPMTLIGCRAEESKYRKIVIHKYGLIHQYRSGDRLGKWRCFPLAWWTTKDVWAYLLAHDLPYLQSYDQWGYDSRTAVIHNFDLHRGKHQERLVSHGALGWLKMQAPEYYALYADLYPEIKCLP